MSLIRKLTKASEKESKRAENNACPPPQTGKKYMLSYSDVFGNIEIFKNLETPENKIL